MTKNKAFSRRGHHRPPPVARPRAPQAPVVKQTEEVRSQKKCAVRRSSQRDLCSSSRSNKPYTKRLQDGLKQVVRSLLLKKPARRTEAHKTEEAPEIDRSSQDLDRPGWVFPSVGPPAAGRPLRDLGRPSALLLSAVGHTTPLRAILHFLNFLITLLFTLHFWAYCI